MPATGPIGRAAREPGRRHSRAPPTALRPAHRSRPVPPPPSESNVVVIVQRILAFIGDRQAARWDRFGGPGALLRWCFGHPWLVTITIAGVLTVVLGVVFGVPPFSPLVLVVVLIAPIAPVLRSLARIHERWTERRSAASSGTDGSPGADDPPGGPPDERA